MFSQPFSAHSRSAGAMSDGVSGKPVGRSGLGSPALGYALTKMGAIRDSSSTCARISFGPSAQLMPTESRGAWEMEFQQASTSCPVSVRSLPACTKVSEAMTGTRRAPSSNSCWMANSAAFRFRTS